jgi:alpha-ketoglutarate-dependent taurine dioxygenase
MQRDLHIKKTERQSMVANVTLDKVVHPHAWSAADIAPGAWIQTLSPEVLKEIMAYVNAKVGTPLPGEPGGPDQLAAGELGPHTHAFMERVRQQIEEGIGFVVIDRFPVEEMTLEQCRWAAWTSFSLVGRVVDQKHTGTRLYDVMDTGVQHAYGVRRSITNLEQEFHTDAPWLPLPPQWVCLFCRSPAAKGGRSRLLSLVTAYNILVEEHPDAVRRLFQDFRWDRQAEHEPDEEKASRRPVFYYDHGVLNVRYYHDYVLSGQQLMGEPLDPEGQAALDALRAIVERPELWLEFTLEAGQFLFVQNRRLAHSRTAFEDTDSKAPKRHYFRLWNRTEGSLRLEGN